MKNIYKNGKYEVKLEKEYNEHKILVDPENENNYVVLGNSKSGNEFYLYYVNDNVDSTVGGIKAKMRLLFKHQSFVQHIFRTTKLLLIIVKE